MVKLARRAIEVISYRWWLSVLVGDILIASGVYLFGRLPMRGGPRPGRRTVGAAMSAGIMMLGGSTCSCPA